MRRQHATAADDVQLQTRECALPSPAPPFTPRPLLTLQTYLLGPALTLAYDPVPNVRLHLAAALPALKRAVALPGDVSLLERLNSGMSHLITDADVDVCQAARRVGGWTGWWGGERLE